MELVHSIFFLLFLPSLIIKMHILYFNIYHGLPLIRCKYPLPVTSNLINLYIHHLFCLTLTFTPIVIGRPIRKIFNIITLFLSIFWNIRYALLYRFTPLDVHVWAFMWLMASSLIQAFHTLKSRIYVLCTHTHTYILTHTQLHAHILRYLHIHLIYKDKSSYISKH